MFSLSQLRMVHFFKLVPLCAAIATSMLPLDCDNTCTLGFFSGLVVVTKCEHVTFRHMLYRHLGECLVCIIIEETMTMHL